MGQTERRGSLAPADGEAILSHVEAPPLLRTSAKPVILLVAGVAAVALVWPSRRRRLRRRTREFIRALRSSGAEAGRLASRAAAQSLADLASRECESRDFIVEQGGLEALLRHLQPPLSPPEESRPPESQHPQQGAHFPETSSPKGDSVAPSRESASSTQVDSVSSVRESEGGHTREAPSVACGDRSKPWRDLELETEAARALYVLADDWRTAGRIVRDGALPVLMSQLCSSLHQPTAVQAPLPTGNRDVPSVARATSNAAAGEAASDEAVREGGERDCEFPRDARVAGDKGLGMGPQAQEEAVHELASWLGLLIQRLHAQCHSVSPENLARVSEAVPSLVHALPALDPRVQYAVLEVLRSTVLFVVRHSIDADSLEPVDASLLPRLVGLLRSPDSGVCRAALALITTLVDLSADTKEAVLQAGALEPTVELLRSTKSRREAALLLKQCTTDNEAFKAMLKRRALPALIDMIQSDSSLDQDAALDTAVSLLRCSDDGKKTLVKEGFLPPAIGLLSSPSSTTQKKAVLFLSHFASEESEGKIFVDCKALSPLIQMLHSSDNDTCYPALSLINRLAEVSLDVKETAVNKGVIGPTIELLSSKRVKCRREAASLLAQLAADDPECAVRIVDLGAIQPLAAMIDAEDGQLKQMAALALECLGLVGFSGGAQSASDTAAPT